MINSFDIDGVIHLGKLGGIYPGPNDIIITGRSYEEELETIMMLEVKNIKNRVYYNRKRFKDKTRISSGQHKGRTLKKLIASGIEIGFHIDDDPIQIEEIRKFCPNLPLILMQHDLVDKENVRHPFP